MTTKLRTARTTDETIVEKIAIVMTAAHHLAENLVAEGILSEATLGPETGEASCLTLIHPGEAEPYHIQPMWPLEDCYDEPCVWLFIERLVPDWEPVPFEILIDDVADMQDDLGAMFEFFRQS